MELFALLHSEGLGPKKKTASLKTAPCHVCAGEMGYVVTLPEAGNLPPLHTFKCQVCGVRRTELHEVTELSGAG